MSCGISFAAMRGASVFYEVRSDFRDPMGRDIHLRLPEKGRGLARRRGSPGDLMQAGARSPDPRCGIPGRRLRAAVRRSIAARVRGAAILQGASSLDVVEVPAIARVDQLAASRARHVPARHSRSPLLAKPARCIPSSVHVFVSAAKTSARTQKWPTRSPNPTAITQPNNLQPMPSCLLRNLRTPRRTRLTFDASA